MKFLLLLVIGSAIATPISLSKWDEFKTKYNKTYQTPEEENMRKGIFMKKLEQVEEANKAEPKISNGFVVSGPAINGFADITWEEYQEMYHLKTKLVYKNFTADNEVGFYKYKGVKVPSTVDHIKAGNVLPARNQGGCGVCWAFSAAASLEGLQAIQSKKAVVLSPTNIFECAGHGDNCDAGGDSFLGIKYSSKLGGVDAEDCYPYTYENVERADEPYQACKESSDCRVPIKFSNPGTYVIQSKDTAANALSMKEVTSVQPISISINWVQALADYDGKSIFYADASSCDPNSTNHAINVVGYGTTDDGKDYWLVKNSHGQGWGKDGFGAVARGFNVCGVESHISFPNGGLI